MLRSCARSVLLILVLLAGSLSPPALSAQEARARTLGQSERGFYLEQNYPNPVASDTYIPFALEDNLFENGDSVVVSLRIYNILKQLIAIPRVQTRPNTRGDRILNLVFRQPGRVVAYWDGKDTAGWPVPSGMYFAELSVNGSPDTRRIVVLNPTRRRSILPRL